MTRVRLTLRATGATTAGRVRVNADRWLCATVEGLLSERRLMNEEPVVRLL